MTRNAAYLATRLGSVLPCVRDATFTAAVSTQDNRFCLQSAAGQEAAFSRSLPDTDSSCSQHHATCLTQDERPVLESGLDSESTLFSVARARLAVSGNGAVSSQSWPSNDFAHYLCPGRTAGHSAVVGVSNSDSRHCGRRSSSQAATAATSAVEASRGTVDRPSLSLESFQGDVRDASLDSNRGPLYEYKRRIRAGLLRPEDQFQVTVVPCTHE